MAIQLRKEQQGEPDVVGDRSKEVIFVHFVLITYLLLYVKICFSEMLKMDPLVDVLMKTTVAVDS